jgi:hypothetical protein
MKAGSKKDMGYSIHYSVRYGRHVIKYLKLRYTGIEINPKNANVAGKRIRELG